MLLKYFRDSPMSGHLGAFKTLNRISSSFYWPAMRREIFQYVRRCDLCQRAKPSQNTRVGLHSATPSSRPLEKLIDFMGPMVRTKRGHQAILVMLDGFSKFVVFYPVKSITSKVVCEALERFYFPAYGVPEAVVSDNASVFKSKPYYDLCFKWGLKRIYTTPYYPQGSLVERANRNLKAALKFIITSPRQDGMRTYPY
jgi:transposase InsO family protein